MSEASVGYLRSGMPYNRMGSGTRPLVVIQGLTFENKPLPWLALRMYNFLREDYTVYSVVRKPGLPPGYTLEDMAGDYAMMIREEFTGPVDVIGVSTGGSIAQPFAADHPELVRRLVIHSSAYTMSHAGRVALMETGRLASQHKWREAWAALLNFSLSPSPVRRQQAWLASVVMSLDVPKDPSDLLITIEADDRFDFGDRLADIRAPTLVVAGDRDPFYTPDLIRETAAGIPNATLTLFPGMGHPVGGRQFQRDVLAFLREGR